MALKDTNALACTYASLILHDDGQDMSAASVGKLLKAAGIDMPAFWPAMYAKALGGVNIGELLDSASNVSAGPPAAAAAAAPAAGGGAAPAAAAKAKEPEPEEDEDMGFSLFD